MKTLSVQMITAAVLVGVLAMAGNACSGQGETQDGWINDTVTPPDATNELAEPDTMRADVETTDTETTDTETTDTDSVEPIDAGEDIAEPDASYDIDCPDGYAPVQPGSFMMGSPAEEPGRWPNEVQHKVTISRGFCIKTTEVTQVEWEDLIGNQPAHFVACGDNCPIEYVTWWDAVTFCNRLSEKDGLSPCYVISGCTGVPGNLNYACNGITFAGLDCTGYRLPTEAEWEYAARAGTTGGTYNGTSELLSCEQPNAILDSIAQFCGHSVDDEGDVTFSSPVGLLDPNALGLYDMLGNVWEWVWDWYEVPSDAHQIDPTGPASGAGHVFRGGSWLGGAGDARAARRHERGTVRHDEDLGFRTVIIPAR